MPVFFSVTICGAVTEPSAVDTKVILVGETETVNVGVAPVPVIATVCGVPVALSATERLAVRVPAASGLNSIETAQVALAASEVAQVLAEIR